MTINISHMTDCWHVDDLKVSHKEEIAIDAFVLNICKIFGNGTKVSRGRVHNYLGMDMEWSQDRTMIVSMIKYLKNHWWFYISDTQYFRHVHVRTLVYGTWREVQETVAWVKGKKPPSHCSPVVGYVYVILSGNPAPRSFPHHQSKVPRRRLLGEAKTGAEVFERYPINETICTFQFS